LLCHLACAWLGGRCGASAPAPLPASRDCRGRRQRYAAGARQLGCAGRSGSTFR